VKVQVVVGLIRLFQVVKIFSKRTSAKVLVHGVDTSRWLYPNCVRSTVEESATLKSQSIRTLHELDREESFTVGNGETVVTPCGLLQNQLRHYLSLPDIETNTMVCRMTEDVVENYQ
jgi:hypothetical protein